jgi:pimeloyl-ACP methyl ester carboxylesterase
VVTVDLAGHGESGDGRREWTMAAFGADVACVLERLELEDAVLVGHSMGGDVIVETALQVPARVSGLVWVDVYTTLGEPRSEERTNAFFAPFREDFAGATRALVRGMFPPAADAELVERVAADMSSAPPEIALDALVRAFTNDGPVAAALGRLSVPVVALNPGSRPTDVEALERHGVRTVVLDGVGHFPMLEDPARFNRVLTDVVESLVRA